MRSLTVNDGCCTSMHAKSCVRIFEKTPAGNPSAIITTKYMFGRRFQWGGPRLVSRVAVGVNCSPMREGGREGGRGVSENAALSKRRRKKKKKTGI